MDRITVVALLILLQASPGSAETLLKWSQGHGGDPLPTAAQNRATKLQASLKQQDHGNWSMTRLQGDNLGTINIDGMVAEDAATWDEVNKSIKQFLLANAAIVGEAGDYDYVVDSVNGKHIEFRQVINGLHMPDSLIYFGDKHEIKLLLLYVSKIDNPKFDKSTWVPTEELRKRTIAIIEARRGSFDPELVFGKPEIYFTFVRGANDAKDEDVSEVELIPVYETIYDHAVQDQISIRMNVLTGELHSLGSWWPKSIP